MYIYKFVLVIMNKFIIMNVRDDTLKKLQNNPYFFPHFFWCIKKNPCLKKGLKFIIFFITMIYILI